MWFFQAIEIIGRTVWAVIQALFSLFPVYQELSGLQDQIIAAAIGVPVIVVSLIGTGIGVVKLIAKRV